MLRSHFVWLFENEEFNQIPKRRAVHHVDHDCQNDDPVNLVLMTYEEHDEYHNSEEALEITRKKRKTFKKHSPESISLLRVIAAGRGNNNIWGGVKKRHFDSTLEKMRAKASAEKMRCFART